MRLKDTTTRKEFMVYLILWLIFALLPLLGAAINASADDDFHFHWGGVLHVWQWSLLLFTAFIIHNHLLAPLLVYFKRSKVYTLCVVVLVGLFFGCHLCCFHKSPGDHNPPPILEEKIIGSEESQQKPGFKPEIPQPGFISPHDITMLVMLGFLIGTNLGVKNYFKTRNDLQKLKNLEHANLKQELEYLKYQVNPHFFMNTLNNIHALVDIDPEVAKKSIVDLSHMMRYVLYDGAQNAIPMKRGIEFMNNYIALMKMRYNDNVEISQSFPEQVPNINVPPLLTIPFVENAFKHGVSYVKPSFIRISLGVDTEQNKILFSCSNSKHKEAKKEPGGVGLVNVTKRLNLLFGHDYDLNISDNEDTYVVTLTIPIKTTANNNET